MFKYITLAILLISSSVCLSDDVKIYEGIWQDTANAHNYYSIQTKDDQIVLIDLSAIESTGSTLESAYIGSAGTYIGSTNNFVINRISPVQSRINSLSLVFESPTEGSFSVICDVCSVVAINIRKIF